MSPCRSVRPSHTRPLRAVGTSHRLSNERSDALIVSKLDVDDHPSIDRPTESWLALDRRNQSKRNRSIYSRAGAPGARQPIDMCQYVHMEAIVACCGPVLETPLREDDAALLAGWFKVLADPARLRLLSLIAAREESCACDLVAPLGVSQPTVSHHLKVLHEAGLVDREKRGRWVYYRTIPESLEVLSKVLA